ncbi:hypothetical protein CRUP_028375 [Coryphaenoides rupestris]|nr:hypothetical protein CRUP_028375 [Coryphaenoides rupestris]
MNQQASGMLNDDNCNSAKEYICKKRWNTKCGSWTPDLFNDYCYLFNYLSMRPWAEARADCLNQGGDLGGWTWADGAPFRYINWSPGNPDDYNGEDCLAIRINGGKWNDDKCEHHRGYICKRRGEILPSLRRRTTVWVLTAVACQDSGMMLHCSAGSVINVQSAFFGRDSADACPGPDGSTGGQCNAEGILPRVRKECDNRPHCFTFAGMDPEPCPAVSKYLRVTYSCEQSVCLQGLGVEDGVIPPSQLSASSSSLGVDTPDKARLNGDFCWMPELTDNSSWIQVNLGQLRKVTGIVIQGCPLTDHWFFPGSQDRHTADTQLLGTPVSAKYIRIFPLEFNDRAGLRFDDSNMCAAAIHAGVVVSDVGGDCTLLKRPGLGFYTGSTRNGITSRQYDGTFSGSYTFADGELRCSGPDWYEFGGFCYKPFGVKVTWLQARQACRGLGAELVSVLSVTEQSWVESYLYLATNDVWTGLHDPTQSGMYVWSDGHETVFTYWAPDEPNNHFGFDEDCVEILHEVRKTAEGFESFRSPTSRPPIPFVS